MIRIKNKKQPLKNSLFWTLFLCENDKIAQVTPPRIS